MMQIMIALQEEAMGQYPAEGWRLQDLKAAAQNPAFCVIVAFLEDNQPPAPEKLAGFAILQDTSDGGDLLVLCVGSGYRRQGVGSALVRWLGQRVRGRMVLEVAAGNSGARAFYASQGFTILGTRPQYYRTLSGREDALLMGLPCPPGSS